MTNMVEQLPHQCVPLAQPVHERLDISSSHHLISSHQKAMLSQYLVNKHQPANDLSCIMPANWLGVCGKAQAVLVTVFWTAEQPLSQNVAIKSHLTFGWCSMTTWYIAQLKKLIAWKRSIQYLRVKIGWCQPSCTHIANKWANIPAHQVKQSKMHSSPSDAQWKVQLHIWSHNPLMQILPLCAKRNCASGLHAALGLGQQHSKKRDEQQSGPILPLSSYISRNGGRPHGDPPTTTTMWPPQLPAVFPRPHSSLSQPRFHDVNSCQRGVTSPEDSISIGQAITW